jgi:inosose dehydratase
LEFEEAAGAGIGYAQMLAELAETGYTGTELGDWGFMPTDPQGLRQALDRHGLDLTGAFVPVNLREAGDHGPGQETALRTARLLAAASEGQAVRPFLVLSDDNCRDPMRAQNAGRVTPEMGLGDGEWATFAQGAMQIAQAVRAETGLATVFHHHCGGFVETPDEIERFLRLTDPALISLVFDTGHFAFGAGGCGEILPSMARWADRIAYIHFKDYAPAVMTQATNQGWDYLTAVAHGIFCELGQGCVDFAGVVRWLQAQGYTGYITVEQDILPGMGAPKASATRNRAYLHQIGV